MLSIDSSTLIWSRAHPSAMSETTMPRDWQARSSAYSDIARDHTAAASSVMRTLVDDLHELAGARVREQVARPHPLDRQRVDVTVGHGVRVERPGLVRRLDHRAGPLIGPAGRWLLARGDAQDQAVPAVPPALDQLHPGHHAVTVGGEEGGVDVDVRHRDVGDPGPLVGAADQPEGPALVVYPLGEVADRVPDDRHQRPEQVGDHDPAAHAGAGDGS